MFKRVLLCYDSSAAGRRALKRGADLAILLGAGVYVLSILPSGVADPVFVAASIGHTCITNDAVARQQLLDESVSWLKSRGVDANGYMATGNTFDVIVEYAKRFSIDLIVLGHYPQPSGGFWWSGSQRGTLAERAKCCIFVAVDAAPSASV